MARSSQDRIVAGPAADHVVVIGPLEQPPRQRQSIRQRHLRFAAEAEPVDDIVEGIGVESQQRDRIAAAHLNREGLLKRIVKEGQRFESNPDSKLDNILRPAEYRVCYGITAITRIEKIPIEALPAD